jgi:hypothetical protein
MSIRSDDPSRCPSFSYGIYSYVWRDCPDSIREECEGPRHGFYVLSEGYSSYPLAEYLTEDRCVDRRYRLGKKEDDAKTV